MGQNIIWEAEYNSALSNNAYSVIHSKLGGYLVGGSIATTTDGLDILILRVDSIGDTLWTKQLGGISDDEAFCVIEDANNDILVSGYTKSYGNGLSDFFITKLNATGVVQWTQTSGGVLKDGSYSIIATLDGGYLTAGYTNSSGAGLKDFYLLKLSATGTFQWAKTYGGSGNDVACDVVQNQDSSIIIVGNTTSFGSSDLNPYIIKTNKNGDTLWTKVIYETGIDIINSVSLVGKTGILLAGNKSITNRLNAQLIKLTATGHVIWQQEYDITGDDEIKDCYQNENGAVYLVGSNSTPEGTSPLCIMTNDYGDLLTNKVFQSTKECLMGCMLMRIIT
ncbi:MAG: hypothetical protein IPO27_01245 [Bacteroidetes bacterium]|nr:hypothetical protein [Bacteroidota bacterium]